MRSSFLNYYNPLYGKNFVLKYAQNRSDSSSSQTSQQSGTVSANPTGNVGSQSSSTVGASRQTPQLQVTTGTTSPGAQTAQSANAPVNTAANQGLQNPRPAAASVASGQTTSQQQSATAGTSKPTETGTPRREASERPDFEKIFPEFIRFLHESGILNLLQQVLGQRVPQQQAQAPSAPSSKPINWWERLLARAPGAFNQLVYYNPHAYIPEEPIREALSSGRRSVKTSSIKKSSIKKYGITYTLLFPLIGSILGGAIMGAMKNRENISQEEHRKSIAYGMLLGGLTGLLPGLYYDITKHSIWEYIF